jgi:hypothetical protein
MSCVFIHAFPDVGITSPDLSESQQENAEDSDVRDERERINTTDVNTLINSDSIVIKNLIKYYDNFLAVDNTCTAMNTKYFPHPGYSQAR